MIQDIIISILPQDLQPVSVTMVLPLPGHVSTDAKSPSIMEMSQTYNVTIQLKPVSLRAE